MEQHRKRQKVGGEASKTSPQGKCSNRTQKRKVFAVVAGCFIIRIKVDTTKKSEAETTNERTNDTDSQEGLLM